MNQFLQNFLRSAPQTLAALRRNLNTLREQNTSESNHHVLRQIFQQIHTLKGSAAAFELNNVSELAHELETLLDHLRFGEIEFNQNVIDALEQGFNEIENALKAEIETPLSPELLAKIRGLSAAPNNPDEGTTSLPAEFLDKLNKYEQKHLRQMQAVGNKVFVIGASFPLADFQQALKDLRDELSQYGEIAATLPGQTNSANEIALNLILCGEIEEGDREALLNRFSCQILFVECGKITFANVCTTAFLAGQNVAKTLGKEVEFEVTGGDLPLTSEQANALQTALLHIVRNAVAHGIEVSAERLKKGKTPCGLVNVTAKQSQNAIHIWITDDGCGIEAESQENIFTAGFSTAENASQTAGRGVGLDAAKSAIENIGGNIRVTSEVNKCTTFEIVLLNY